MRSKADVAGIIKKIAKENFGENAQVYLFGSRINDQKKGGDIDLYIETDVKENLLDRKLKMLVDIKKIFGEQKIDIVVNNFQNNKHVYSVAKREGLRL